MSKMTNDNGNKVWRNAAGQYHRVDGPAVIHRDGYQAWYVNGQYHRLNSPAIIYPDGTKIWYENNACHCLDGPAFIGENGYQYWYVNNINLTDHAIVWIKENNFPDYTLWTDTQKIMFKLAFSGISA